METSSQLTASSATQSGLHQLRRLPRCWRDWEASIVCISSAVTGLPPLRSTRAGTSNRSAGSIARHACGYALANIGHDTRALQAWLGDKAAVNARKAGKRALLGRLPAGSANVVAKVP